ncbi:MAG: response regulator transcription factor [Verrucomicrobia bacterium]|nr:response regulator transcription factor [Verrucomicrobiota bacterium]
MNPPEPPLIRVALVEDDAQIRESLAVLIEGAPGFRCVSRHADAESALAALPKLKPDVVLMDIRLPRLSGIECARQIKTALPAVQIVMLTVFEDDERVFDSLTAGASGYLIKRTPPAQILEAIAEVHRGGSPMSSAIARKVVQYVQTVARPSGSELPVSAREQEILDRLARGFRYKEIADALGISMDTVRSHIRRIYEKLQVHSRTEAVVKFLGR